MNELHNPANLAPEQIAERKGFRIQTVEEWREACAVDRSGAPDSAYVMEAWSTVSRKWDRGKLGSHQRVTYITNLTPAELRKARGLEPKEGAEQSDDSRLRQLKQLEANGVELADLRAKLALAEKLHAAQKEAMRVAKEEVKELTRCNQWLRMSPKERAASLEKGGAK